jgi:hypothetical protein
MTVRVKKRDQSRIGASVLIQSKPRLPVARPARYQADIVHPRGRRSAPDLPHRPEPVALTDTAPADSPIVGTTLTAREKRGTAFATEVLKTCPSVIAGPGVDLRGLPRHQDVVQRADHRYPVGRAGEPLTIRAVADRHALWIDIGLIGHVAAMAPSIYLHSSLPPLASFAQKKTAPERRRFIILTEERSSWSRLSAPSGRRPPRHPHQTRPAPWPCPPPKRSARAAAPAPWRRHRRAWQPE